MHLFLTAFNFEVESKSNVKKIEKRPVIWTKAEDILESVIAQREIIGNFFIKIMADGGQGFFKISMTVISEN